MHVFLIGCLVCYALMLLLVAFRWEQIPITKEVGHAIDTTLIIPFRNEVSHVDTMVSCIKYLEPPLPVLLVDDHSTDQGAQRFMEASLSQTQVLSLQDSEGKKAAIAFGVAQASTTCVLATDADCEFGPEWPGLMQTGLLKNDFVFGPVAFKSSQSILSQMQTYEMAILQVFSGACWAMGYPTMCNGANVGYTVDAFRSVNGFESHRKVASGDDELLMHDMLQGGRQIGYVKPKKPLVSTTTAHSLQDFMHQRRRWAGKWRHYSYLPSRLLALLIFLFNASFVLGLVATMAGWVSLEFLLGFAGTKWLIEMIFIQRIGAYFRLKIKLLPLTVLATIYPFYVVFFGIVSHFGSYIWKDRTIRNGAARNSRI